MITPLVESAGQNLNDVRLLNRAVIFRAIREAGLISRASLAKGTGLNPATVTHIIRELLNQGLVEEAGPSESKGGRPGSMLRIRSQAGYIVSIQLDRLYIKGMVANLNLDKSLQEQVISADPAHPSDISLDMLIQLIHTLIERSGLEQEQFLGIGICAPGPLDPAKGVIRSAPNFPGWLDLPIRQIVQQEFNVPTFLEQDANACALAEKWFGAARSYENFVYLLGDGGLGGGLFIHGDIYGGRHDIAGEIGHTTINLDGPQCACGNYGCLELYASAHAVENRVCAALSEGRSSILLDLVGGRLDRITFQAVAHAAQQGDPLCLEMIHAMGEALAIGVTNIMNLIDPEAVVIGGQIALAESLIGEIINERLSRFSLAGKADPSPVVFSTLRQDAPIVGAFSLVLRELFRDPFFRQ